MVYDYLCRMARPILSAVPVVDINSRIPRQFEKREEPITPHLKHLDCFPLEYAVVWLSLPSVIVVDN